MRLAKDTERIHAAGAEVMAISVNELERQVGMRSRWRLDDQLLVSDPGGETYLQSLGLFDPEERGGIALPGLLVITPDGSEAYRYQGRDFADRTTDDEMYAALEGLGGLDEHVAELYGAVTAGPGSGTTNSQPSDRPSRAARSHAVSHRPRRQVDSDT